MSRLENHAMLRDAATDVFNLLYALLFSWKTDFLGYCSREGQIHWRAPHLFLHNTERKKVADKFCLVISNNSIRPKKGKKKQKKPKKRLTSQTSGSSSGIESCRSTLTVCSDGTTDLQTVFGYNEKE